VPVLFARGEPHDIAQSNLFDWPAPTLRPAHTGGDDQGLAERVRVPCRARARLERDARAGHARRSGRVEQRINPYRSDKPLGGSFD
jgi:hypothetical protein